MKAHGTASPLARNARAGFTLIELVVVIAIFGLVMSMAYQILDSTIRSEQSITRQTRSGKVGQGILQQIRRDLQGAVWRSYGPDVFLGLDGGSEENAQDEFHFITTSPVPEFEDVVPEMISEVASVGYVLKPGEEDWSTLYRRVKWELEDDPLGGGEYYEVYGFVRGMDVRYLGREEEWLEDWESAPSFEDLEDENRGSFLPFYDQEEENAEIDALNAAESGDPTDLVDDDEDLEEVMEIPLPIPRAVEVVLYLGVGDERGPFLDPDDNPILERVSTIIPLIASEVLRVEDPDEETDETGDGSL